MVAMVTGSMKFVIATVLFARAFIKAVINYAWEGKPTIKEGVQGVGLEKDIPSKLPSIVEIKRVLPKHCLQPLVSTSMYFALKDFVLIAITFATVLLIHQIHNPWIWYPTLILYWAFQGTLFTSVFVIGHDCGHDSFSMHSWLNILVGNIYHGFLLTPFYMWKLSHRQHHKNNANLDKDEVFYPVRISEPCSKNSILPGFGFGLGWFGYLANGYSPRRVPHFNPFHKFFTGNVFQCTISLTVCLLWGTCLYKYATVYGFGAWFNYYFVPLFIFASYCVIITFLHHSEVNVPWFAEDQWDFVKGQLSTVDRDYGIVHYLIHNIGTHQMHHMFTKIPHYHLEEATRHFRQAFPELVRICHEPILASFMRMFKKYQQQGVIADNTKVHKYH